jgi:histone deacetylase complex regulatory component SIN3
MNVPDNMKKYEHPHDESVAFLRSKDKHVPVYNAFMSQLFSLMDGSIDGNKYEDTCRQLLTNKGYFVYTLDKVIQQLLKCLQSLANDENVTKLVGMFMYYRTHTDGIDPTLYEQHIGSMFGTSLEDVYRIQLMTRSQHETQEPITVGCQLMGTVVDMNKSSATTSSIGPIHGTTAM